MKKVLRVIADLKFAISLLVIISVTITIGSIIEQDQTLEYYKENYPEIRPLFGFLTWKFIDFIGIDHLYRTIWFIALLIIFGTSLISCTFLQQFPTLKFSRRCNFFVKKKLDIETLINQENLGKFINKIINQGYYIYQQKTNFYATKGIIGRVAPVFVHLSILLILFGSIIAALCGFNAQELIPKSEIIHIQNTVIAAPLSRFSQQSIRVNDFWINYYKDSKIKQFYSNISILNDNGLEILNKTISVNQPLIYKNLTLYQTDWTFVGLRLQETNKSFQIPVILTKNMGNKVWFSWLPFKSSFTKENFLGETLLINNYKENILTYDLKGNLMNEVDKNEKVIENHYELIDFISSTGLQIKSDPGTIFIYFGFGFLMLSTFLSYLSFSQIWGIFDDLKNKKNLIVLGKTSRSKFSFDTEIFKITKDLN
jgi:cytochrome c biogenesis protein